MTPESVHWPDSGRIAIHYVHHLRYIEQHFLDALRVTLQDVQLADCCVGHLNLRGWGQLADIVDARFNVHSTHPATGHKRYVEVKARAKVGPVALTQNEWFKASRFGFEFYLYVVLNSATQPELYIVQDPAANLQPQERVEVRYLVSVNQILSRNVKEE